MLWGLLISLLIGRLVSMKYSNVLRQSPGIPTLLNILYIGNWTHRCSSFNTVKHGFPSCYYLDQRWLVSTNPWVYTSVWNVHQNLNISFGKMQLFVTCKKLQNCNFMAHCMNPSPPSAAYMRQGIIGLALVQITACRLFGDKPLSKPMLFYCQSDL